MKTKNGHILTFSDEMQISALLCFATCDWFCPMMSQMSCELFVIICKSTKVSFEKLVSVKIIESFIYTARFLYTYSVLVCTERKRLHELCVL